MSTLTKLMACTDKATGVLYNIKLYAYNEYKDASDLVDLKLWPTGSGPWVYDSDANLAVAMTAALTLSDEYLVLAPNNKATCQMTVSGPPGANVDAKFEGAVPIDAVKWTLDASGEAVVTFGPTCLRTAQPLKIYFDIHENSFACPAELKLELG